MEIPGYQMVRMIAEGGMSTVYLAVQQSLGRPVALKLLRKFDHPEQAERFLNEARTIAALQHRNVITIHDVGRVGERYYIAMEYLEGGSLRERIEQGITAEEAVDLLERIAACLDFVHRRDVVHRDLKPSNILFHADGTPRLTDFGIAKQLDADQEHTMDGSAFGSPYYLSPEQAEGRPLDGRCDIYALGVVFYQMLTGRLPYAENSHIETIVAHLSEPIPVLPAPLSAYQDLLERMLAKQPAARIASAAELVREIQQLRQRLKRRTPASRAETDAAPATRLWRGAARHLRAAPPAVKIATAAVALIVVGSIVLAPDDAGHGTIHLQAAAPALAAEADVGAQPAAEAAAPWPAGGGDTAPARRTGGAKVPDLPLAEPAAAPPVARAGSPDDEAAAPPDPVAVSAQHTGDPPSSAQAAHEAATGSAERTEASELAETVEMGEPGEPGEPGDLAEPARAAGPIEPTEAAQAAPLADSPPSEDPTAAAITAHLRAGDAALRRLRLTTPADDNAYDHYARVLEHDPRHAGARSGMDRIAERYAALTRKALEAGEHRLAGLYLERGLGVREDHAGLQALRRDLDAALAPPPPPRLAARPTPEERRPDRVEDPGRKGTGNFVQDMKSVWRSIFN